MLLQLKCRIELLGNKLHMTLGGRSTKKIKTIYGIQKNTINRFYHMKN
jgi:hypothetical protein